MNEEELAALAEKLLAQGLPEDEILAHLSHAKHGGAAEPGIGEYVAEAGKGLGDVALAIPRTLKAAGHAVTEALPGLGHEPNYEPAKELALSIPMMGYNAEKNAMEAEGPEKVRALMNLASLGLLGLGAKGKGPALPTAAAAARGGLKLLPSAKAMMGKGAQVAGGVGKAMFDELPVVGRRGIVGRPVRAGLKAAKAAMQKTPDATEVVTETFEPIEGTGGGVTTEGMSAGEARAANAPLARAKELASRRNTVSRETPITSERLPEGVDDALTQGARQRVQPGATKGRLSRFAKEQAERYQSYDTDRLVQITKNPNAQQVAKDGAQAELVKRGVGIS